MLKINKNSNDEKVSKDMVMLLADEVVAIENTYLYPELFWSVKKETKQDYIKLINQNSVQHFSQKFNQLVKTKIGNINVSFKKPLLKEFWFDHVQKIEENFKQIKEKILISRNLNKNCDFNHFYETLQIAPFTEAEKKEIRATLINSFINYHDNVIESVDKEIITNLDSSIKFANKYYNEVKPIGDTIIKYKINKELAIKHAFMPILCKYNREGYLLLNSTIVESTSDFYNKSIADVFNFNNDKEKKVAAIAQSVGITFLYDEKRDNQDQFLYVLITTSDPIVELQIEKELVAFAEKSVKSLKEISSEIVAQQLGMKWKDYIIDIDVDKVTQLYDFVKSDLVRVAAVNGISYQKALENAREKYKLNLKRESISERSVKGNFAKEWLEIENDYLYDQSILDGKKDEMQVLNKVEKELKDYCQEVQQLKEEDDVNKKQAELNRQIKKVQLLKAKLVEKSKVEVIEKTNDEFNIANYHDESFKVEVAVAERKLGFKILLNPQNAVNISITNELEKFKWEEMTFDQKLKLAEAKQMRGSLDFNTKTKNIILFAEERYGNNRILKEKIEKSKDCSGMTKYYDRKSSNKVEDKLEQSPIMQKHKNIQAKDNQVPSTSREIAKKNSTFTQFSAASRNIEINSINSKEKEIEKQLMSLQALKAKKVESLQETKKQFDQQKMAVEAEKMEKATTKKAKAEKTTVADKKTKKKHCLCS